MVMNKRLRTLNLANIVASWDNIHYKIPLACVAQSVTCLTTDAHLTADPGVASLVPARSHTYVEIDHEIISSHSPPFR